MSGCQKLLPPYCVDHSADIFCLLVLDRYVDKALRARREREHTRRKQDTFGLANTKGD